MENVKRLIINVVTWNHARYLPTLFESLDAQTSSEFTVTVIDNASTDGSAAWVESHRPDVMMLKNYRNLGFSRGHNQGIALARSRWEKEDRGVPPSETDSSNESPKHSYVFILNPDVVLEDHAVERMLSFMDAHPDVEIAGPKLLRAIFRADAEGFAPVIERTNVIDSTGIMLKKSRAAIDRGAGEEDNGQYDAVDPFGITGAALVLRASAIPTFAIDGASEIFDEEFFAYKEDVDFAWRARLLGARAAVIPDAVAWHQRAARPDAVRGLVGIARGQWKKSAFTNELSRRNKTWVEWKNDDWSNRFMHFPWIFPQLLLRFLSMFVSLAQLKGTVAAWRGLPHMLEKRKKFMARRRLSPTQMRAWFV